MPALLAWLVFAFLIWLLSRAGKRRRNRQHADSWWDWYDAYLRSPEWQEKRRACFERAGGICEECGLPVTWPWFQVHHQNYENVGNERPEDLRCVHYDCHRALHPGRSF